MNWLKRLFEYFGWTVTRVEKEEVEQPKVRYHCIRFMTDRGEQVGILLSDDELETGLRRWVDTIEEMPSETANPTDDERIP